MERRMMGFGVRKKHFENRRVVVVGCADPTKLLGFHPLDSISTAFTPFQVSGRSLMSPPFDRTRSLIVVPSDRFFSVGGQQLFFPRNELFPFLIFSSPGLVIYRLHRYLFSTIVR